MIKKGKFLYEGVDYGFITILDINDYPSFFILFSKKKAIFFTKFDRVYANGYHYKKLFHDYDDGIR